MLVRVCEEVLCARLAHSPNEREGEMCEMISMQKSFWFFFFLEQRKVHCRAKKGEWVACAQNPPNSQKSAVDVK